MWQWVARGNIQQISYSPDGAAFTLRAHAALSGECFVLTKTTVTMEAQLCARVHAWITLASKASKGIDILYSVAASLIHLCNMIQISVVR